MSGEPAATRDLRRFIEVQPVLDFNALEPGAKASAAIRQAAADLKLADEFGARVRLTGQVAIADEEFGTLKEGALLNGIVTILVVLVILWLALRSGRIILAVFLSLVVGLAITAALGLMMVSALNLISIAFAVLFVGIGVDFGLQFSVRYRAERHDHDDIKVALRSAAVKAGGPLALAAAATAAGFFSFLPTHYKGLSELGLIAGSGMLIAFITSITLLPALLRIFNPQGEPNPLGYSSLAPVDRFLERNRIPVIVGTLSVVVLRFAPALFPALRFQSHQSAQPEGRIHFNVSRTEERSDDKRQFHRTPCTLASRGKYRRRAPEEASEVSGTTTLSSFVPGAQQEKLGLIQRAARGRSIRCSIRGKPNRHRRMPTMSRPQNPWPTG